MAAQRDWPAAGLLYALFAPVCHQMAERSFHLGATQLAACHRCTGLYLGFFLGLLLWPMLQRPRAWLLAEPRRVLFFLTPMLLDFLLLSHNVSLSRFLTGLLAAFPVALLTWVAACQLASPNQPFLEGPHEPSHAK